MRYVAMALAALLTGGPALASEQTRSPYAGEERRAIKALSASEIAGLREGQGMALALAAELNGHPGPLHVLELADGLALTPEQRVRTQAVFDAMKARAMALGEEVVALEAELDHVFRADRPDPARVEALSGRIGQKRGELRAAHLTAHLEMNAVLDAEQRARYAALRGYETAGQPGTHGHDGRGHGDGHGGHGHGGHGH